MSLEFDNAFHSERLAFGEWKAIEKPGILIVDDEPQLITAMTDLLDEQYRIVGETSPPRALEILRQDLDIHVIISDQRMPVMTGDEFLSQAREISAATRIFVTAYADLGAVINAVNNGKIFNYIRKPWDEAEFRSIVDAAVQHFALRAKLEHERILLKCIMDCSLDAISVKDTSHRYIRLNLAEAAILSANTPKDVNGRSHAEFLPAHRTARWDEEEDRLLETLEAVRNRVEHIVESDGSEYWYATTKAPIRRSRGEPIGLVSITRDVTETKKIEQIKDDFISTARHELRTPLTVIASTTKLIRTGRFGSLEPRAEKLLAQSEANCDRLLSLINNMLDIQDIMVGRVHLQMSNIPVRDLINDSRDLNALIAKASEIEVQIGDIPDLTVTGDRQRLSQVLCNLLSNACKFSPKQTTVNITVSEDPDRIQISVVDQGPGVPIAFTDKLFTSFSQCDSSANRSYGGAGIGLRVCKAIVEAHGGRIGFMPAPGAGSKFFVSLPRVQSLRIASPSQDALATENDNVYSLAALSDDRLHRFPDD